MRLECQTPYSGVVTELREFALRHPNAPTHDVTLPASLTTLNMHLDPDFRNLTYGDSGTRRGKCLVGLQPGDAVVFYAGLRPVTTCVHRLVYAPVGLYRVREIARAGSVISSRYSENAHTRCIGTEPADVIVRADENNSGRLTRCIPIGEFRERAYRVQSPILESWGGLSCKNGYLQRSAVLPSFKDPEKFLVWFAQQKPEFVASNNV